MIRRDASFISPLTLTLTHATKTTTIDDGLTRYADRLAFMLSLYYIA